MRHQFQEKTDPVRNLFLLWSLILHKAKVRHRIVTGPIEDVLLHAAHAGLPLPKTAVDRGWTEGGTWSSLLNMRRKGLLMEGKKCELTPMGVKTYNALRKCEAMARKEVLEALADGEALDKLLYGEEEQ